MEVRRLCLPGQCAIAERAFTLLQSRVGDAGMLQALNDLSVFGKENTLELEKTKFDMTKLDLVATISSNNR